LVPENVGSGTSNESALHARPVVLMRSPPMEQTPEQEIALRHTALKKNKVDGVRSTLHVPLRDVSAFIAVMNETVKP
jgi:hypothetical protein